MSGFSADWLALREPADAAARSVRLSYVLSHAVLHHASLRILDLGGGTGSNIRFLAPLLAKPQHWTLVDHDEALLAQVPARMAAWARSRCGWPKRRTSFSPTSRRERWSRWAWAMTSSARSTPR